jgi:FG-GAP-like repeat/PASTA domain
MGKGSAAVELADLNGDGKPDVVAADDRGSTVSGALNRGNGQFGARAEYRTAPHPQILQTVDLNGDGKPDLLTANRGRSFSVLLNRGKGTFEPRRDYATKESPTIAIGDLNGDGKPDVVGLNFRANTVSVFLNHGDGRFEPSRDFVTGQSPFSPTIADLNGDGSPDLAIAVKNGVSLLFNDGTGGFAARREYGAAAGWFAVVDLNGDGRRDLVSWNGVQDLSVLLNRGDGSFTVRRREDGNVLAIADLNGDQRPDLVTEVWQATAEGWSATVEINTGDGNFRFDREYRVGDHPYSGTVADLNGDGRPELIITRNEGAKTGPGGPVVSVHLNRGGRFQPSVEYPTRGVAEVETVDANGDGRPDLVTSGTSAVSVLMNKPGLCDVQSVWELKLAAAKERLARAGCRVGKIRHAYSGWAKKGQVTSQRPDFGAVLRAGAKVNLVVSKGRRK